jgi:hypothetical protein
MPFDVSSRNNNKNKHDHDVIAASTSRKKSGIKDERKDTRSCLKVIQVYL